jgi:fimbrial isopeptide formation D2 family protein
MSPSITTSTARHPIRHRVAVALVAYALILATQVAVAPAPATATEPENCGVVPIDLVFVIDRSGSMNTQEGAKTRLGWAKQAANDLVDLFDANGGVGSTGSHRIGLSTFGGTTASSPIDLVDADDAATIEAAVNAISASGGTPFELGMENGRTNMLNGDRATHNGEPVTQVLIFLSDGNPDPDSYAPDGTQISDYLAAADKAYAVAIGPDGGNLGQGGTGVSYALMRSISKPAYVDDLNPGGFRAVTSASGLPNLFGELYQEIACPKGKLEVRKQLSPSNDPGRFDLWIGGTLLADEAGHNGTTGEQELDGGIVAFSETADGETALANYSASVACVDTANNDAPVTATPGQGASWTVDVASGSDIVCTITNARNTGSLKVTKVVTIDDGGSATCDDFGFKVNGGSTIGFEAECTNVLTLPTGTYSVAEPPVAGYDTTYQNCSEVAVVNGQQATCTIENDDQPGELIVIKDLTTDDGSDASCDDFSFAVDGGNPIAFEADCTNEMTVDAGTYSVVETDADGFSTEYANCSGLQVPNGGSATCTVSNDDQPGELIVNKVIIGGDASPDDFSFRVNGGSATDFEPDGSNSLSVPAGSYSVVETTASGWDTSYENCSQVRVPNGGSATCTITNERQTGSLKVDKQVTPAEDDGKFDLVVDGEKLANEIRDGGTTGWLTLETGTHTVGEVADGETTLADYASEIECRANGGEGSVIASAAGAGPLEVNVTNGAEVLCVIHNTRVQVTIVKSNDAGENGTVWPGDVIHYELEVTVNDGTATSVVVTDELPDGLTYVPGSADPAAGFAANGQELTWTVGNLAAGTYHFEYDASVDEDAAGRQDNLGCVDADQNDEAACDETSVLVQLVSIEKTSGVEGSVVPGSSVDFTLTLGVLNGPIESMVIVDQLPDGIASASAISDGGVYDAASNQITWELEDVADGQTLTYSAVVSATAGAGEYTNVATITDGPCVGDGCDDDSTVTVRVPALVIDKSADSEVVHFMFDAEGNVLSVDPEQVTWTLTWTLTDGPVTNAVISDELPDFLSFVSASDGGVYDDASRTVTWQWAELSVSGSVSVVTTVDADAPETEPIVNVATIVSDQTPSDGGEDEIRVTSQSEQGGNPPTPKPSVPDTALVSRPGGTPLSIPVELFVALFVGSLGALAYANVRAVRRRG